MLREAGAIDSFLTGRWQVNYKVNSIMDSSGNTRKNRGYRTKYIDLTHNKSLITGNLVGADRDGCSEGKIEGKIVGNNIEWTQEHTGSCCPNAKSTYQGNIDFGSNAFFIGKTKIVGEVKPLTTPPENCNMWFASFEASPVRQ